MVSGLTINLSKSNLYGVGKIDCLAEIASVLGCGIDSFPLTYLGLPLGAKCKSSSLWEKVVERVSNRLSGWKAKCL